MKTQEQWIINGTLLTQDQKRRALKANLQLINGHIVAITKRLPRRSGRTTIIDASGLTILPGFVQAHVHLCQTLFRNQADDMELLDWLSKRIWVMEGAHTPATLRASARLGIHELLSSGTTCILDMGTVRHTDAIFTAVKESGIRANVGKCLMDNPKTNPPYLCESTNSAIQEALSLFEHWNGAENDRIRASFAPRFVISCTDQLLREVADLAKAQNALIHTHASENRKEIEFVKKLVGTENVEYLHKIGMTSPRLVLAHCIWLNKKEKLILKKTGTHTVHCPSSNMKLASGFMPAQELRSMGINVALGADGAPCNNNLDMFREMRLAALIHKPSGGPKTLRAQEVLDMATRDGAKALSWFDDIGSIEVGKKADLIALDLQKPSNTVPAGSETNSEMLASSVVYSAQSSDVKWAMVDGTVVAQNGKVLAIPAKQLMRDVRQAQLAIRKTIDYDSSTDIGQRGEITRSSAAKAD
ncbi:MAG TPA: N-ethylammeline chlorohydrolase [Bdellovibrionales bacterium]|nr:MAG: hypothetical protein A2X97_10765 [Bdellovibrionales bacterium GWA1_52_35]OFZ42788.1 MAG: hypothetical protein A2070_07745 [Bdellovibrionales bacterium GWC1_52_8]HAR41129.1 N-ethylammeline chlorohydrolase [Bdellovibrionales bacterium]HCM38602.1 N-ethylammeline chlorohydrolase [Bdellovibrionales bacterium]